MASLPPGAWVVITMVAFLAVVGFLGGVGPLIYRVICRKKAKARVKAQAQAQVNHELTGVVVTPGVP